MHLKATIAIAISTIITTTQATTTITTMTDHTNKIDHATHTTATPCVSTSVDNQHDCLSPPTVASKAHVVSSPYGKRLDEYYWLRDDERTNPDMLAYLNAENAYADAIMRPLKPTEDKIFDEIVSRIKQDDSSIPYREHGYWYYARYESGKDYPIYARRADTPNTTATSIQQDNDRGDFATEEILLNVNELAKGHDYYSAFVVDVSKDNQKIIWADDTNGRRQYTLKIKDLTTGKISNEIKNTSGQAVFVDNDSAFLYVKNHPETLLGNKVKRHALDSNEQDALIYEEKDDTFYMGLGLSRDEHYIIIHSSSTLSDEVRYAPKNNSHHFQVLAPRQRGLEYNADHHNNHWVIRTNADNAKNFKLMTAPSNATSTKQWRNTIAYNPKVYIDEFMLFDDFIAINERSDGLNRIRIIDNNKKEHYIKADESAYTMDFAVNSEPNTHLLRYHYVSMTTPNISYELNLKTGERTQLKQRPVPNYNADNYLTERVWVPARDGTKIPVSLVYHKDFKKDGTAGLLQYAYGSYGSSTDPFFSTSTISLLDRGMVFAIAHVRGGQEMGRDWYDQGKLFHKMNTFTDFIDVTRWLVNHGYAAKDRIAAQGGSAGGLLMGAIANLAPKDYRVILSQVPFVDVVTTMLDESIPLTTGEYDEWGNPAASKESYQYMLAYSPYDNLKQQSYPAMFVGTGLWDSQVQYWEPAKYVARLRSKNTSPYPIIFRTNMEAGHGGKSGRFNHYREVAEMYAFMLNQIGVH